jgi:hypothetical protein
MNNLVVISIQNFHNTDLHYLVDVGINNPSISVPINAQKICEFYDVSGNNVIKIRDKTTCNCLNTSNQLTQLLQLSTSTTYRVTIYKI